MNMMDRFGLTQCPYCSTGLLPWTPGKRLHHCERCQRPLAIYRSILHRRRFRIIPLYAAVHATAALLAGVGFTSVLIAGGGVRAIVLAIAIPLALFGASDVADGYLSWRTRIDRSWRKVREGRGGRRLGLAKIAWGAMGCFVAVCGLMALAPASPDGVPPHTSRIGAR
jgi:hypothetical protein